MTRVISKPLGRPVSTGRGDAVRVTVRLSEEEARAYRLAAGDAGLTVAEWMRHAAAARLAQEAPCPHARTPARAPGRKTRKDRGA